MFCHKAPGAACGGCIRFPSEFLPQLLRCSEDRATIEFVLVDTMTPLDLALGLGRGSWSMAVLAHSLLGDVYDKKARQQESPCQQDPSFGEAT